MTTPAIIAGAIRRQKILNVLLEHGPLLLAELASHVGETRDRCGSDLNTAQVRGEIEYIPGTHRNNGRWMAVARTATFADPKRYASKHREHALRRMQDKAAEKSVPGLRVVRMLDRPAYRNQGGQGGQKSGIQSSLMHGGALHV